MKRSSYTVANIASTEIFSAFGNSKRMENPKKKYFDTSAKMSTKPISPHSGEWSANVRYGGERANDPAYYFRGCYSLEKIDGGYRYTVKEPYCD